MKIHVSLFVAGLAFLAISCSPQKAEQQNEETESWVNVSILDYLKDEHQVDASNKDLVLGVVSPTRCQFCIDEVNRIIQIGQQTTATARIVVSAEQKEDVERFIAENNFPPDSFLFDIGYTSYNDKHVRFLPVKAFIQNGKLRFSDIMGNQDTQFYTLVDKYLASTNIGSL